MIGETKDFFKIPDVIEFMNFLEESENVIAKIDVTIDPNSNTYNWTDIRNKIMEKPIWMQRGSRSLF